MNSLRAFNASQFNAGLVYAWPEIFLALAACAILMLDLLLNDAQRRWTGVLAIISLVVDRRAGGGAAGVRRRSWRSAGCSNWIAWRRC